MGSHPSLLFGTVLREDSDDAEQLATLANALRSFKPLFSPINDGLENYNFISDTIDDFMGIYWGDEPRFFSITSKSQGAHKRPFRLAKLRLTALDWEKYLEAAGLSAFERQNIVSEAYRTSWDAIRKWKNSIADSFDLVSLPPDRPDWVREEYQQDPKKINQKIIRDGLNYWAEKRTTGQKKVVQKVEKNPEYFPEM